MIKVSTYSSTGTKGTDTTLPKRYETPVNDVLLAQALRVYEWRSHTGLSKTKSRGEINLTKSKWYRQKGTGRARHGAKSAPIFVGGSKAHGPKGVKRQLSLNKDMRVKSLNVALSLKAKDKDVVIVSGISNVKKTKEAQILINKISDKHKGKKKIRVTFVLSEENRPVQLALRNLKDVGVLYARNLNAYDVYFGGLLIVDKDALEAKPPKIKSTKKGASKK